jgi:hypothetical protein
MNTLLQHLRTLCIEWDVWSITSQDPPKHTAVITRSDEDQISVTVTVAPSYPRGPVTLVDTFGRRYVSANEQVTDALDNALVKWVDEEEGLTERNPSSQIYDVGYAALGGHAESTPLQAALIASKDMVAAHANDPALKGMVWYRYDDARHKFIVRIATPLSWLDTFRASALGLDRAKAIVVELCLGWQYLDAPSPPAVTDIFMTQVVNLGRDSENAERGIGSVKWMLKNRLETALNKNHILLERRRANYAENEDEQCPDYSRIKPKFPEENFFANGNRNYFAGLLRLLDYRLRNCTSVCAICDDPLPFDGMKMGICDKELCHHSAEAYGLGCDVLHELQRNPEVCELLISLTLFAAISGKAGRDVFNPMCPVLLSHSANSTAHGPMHFYVGDYGTGPKNFELLESCVQQIPPIDKMVQMANGSESALRDNLNAINPLVFPLLRWILSSNRAHLEAIPEKHQIAGLGTHQFHLVSSNPAKEGRFRDRKAQAAVRGAKKFGNSGSFHVWHGSAPGNWHSILRMGLRNYSNTKFMSAGAAYGPGIYTANSISTSHGYMGQVCGTWRGAHYIKSNGGFRLISLCELVDEVRDKHPTTGQATLKDANDAIVTVQDEDLIGTRFLFLFPDAFSGDTSLVGHKVQIPADLLNR